MYQNRLVSLPINSKRMVLASLTSTLLLSIGWVSEAEAANFSFRGTFSADDDVQLFNFTLGSPSMITLKTLSYAGGTQADGTVIAAGGFDPILAVFDSDGNFIARNDDGDLNEIPSDPTTGESLDTFLKLSLSPGNYTVAVTQYDNFFIGDLGDNISLGFAQQGNPNFTADIADCPATQFCDYLGNARTNEWAFDILNVKDADAIPEPLTILGAGTALGFATFFKRKLSKTAKKDETADS
jgi:hypothetical protein